MFIIPHSGADDAVTNEVRFFHRSTSNLTNEDLLEIIGEASKVMGIKMTPDDTDPSLKAFSKDILKIQISGPTQEHFTVIDVPGIFRFPQSGLTTESDVSLVRNMVESYMENSRTVILAVLPSNIDTSNQEILTDR